MYSRRSANVKIPRGVYESILYYGFVTSRGCRFRPRAKTCDILMFGKINRNTTLYTNNYSGRSINFRVDSIRKTCKPIWSLKKDPTIVTIVCTFESKNKFGTYLRRNTNVRVNCFQQHFNRVRL